MLLTGLLSISALAQPTVTLSQKTNSTTPGDVQLLATIAGFPFSGPFTYTWTCPSSPGSITSAGPSCNVTSPPPTGLLCFLTVSGCGTSISTSFSVLQPVSCCQPSILNPSNLVVNNKRASQLYGMLDATPGSAITPGMFGGGIFAFEGTFIVDVPTNFAFCTIVMGPDAEILVDPNNTVAYSSCYITCACPYMWKWIQAITSNSSIVVNSCQVSNGQFAVRALNGAGVLVQGSSFTNCYVGVQCGSTPPGYGGYISTNSFVNSGAGLLPPYTGTGNGFGVGSVHRQSLEVGDVSGGTGNYFSGLSTGVYLLTSVPPSGGGAYNTVLSNNNFSNIRGSRQYLGTLGRRHLGTESKPCRAERSEGNRNTWERSNRDKQLRQENSGTLPPRAGEQRRGYGCYLGLSLW